MYSRNVGNTKCASITIVKEAMDSKPHSPKYTCNSAILTRQVWFAFSSSKFELVHPFDRAQHGDPSFDFFTMWSVFAVRIVR